MSIRPAPPPPPPQQHHALWLSSSKHQNAENIEGKNLVPTSQRHHSHCCCCCCCQLHSTTRTCIFFMSILVRACVHACARAHPTATLDVPERLTKECRAKYMQLLWCDRCILPGQVRISYVFLLLYVLTAKTEIARASSGDASISLRTEKPETRKPAYDKTYGRNTAAARRWRWRRYLILPVCMW